MLHKKPCLNQLSINSNDFQLQETIRSKQDRLQKNSKKAPSSLGMKKSSSNKNVTLSPQVVQTKQNIQKFASPQSQMSDDPTDIKRKLKGQQILLEDATGAHHIPTFQKRKESLDVFGELTSRYLSQNSDSKRTIHSKRRDDFTKVRVNSNFMECLLQETKNPPVDEGLIMQGLKDYYNSQKFKIDFKKSASVIQPQNNEPRRQSFGTNHVSPKERVLPQAKQTKTKETRQPTGNPTRRKKNQSKLNFQLQRHELPLGKNSQQQIRCTSQPSQKCFNHKQSENEPSQEKRPQVQRANTQQQLVAALNQETYTLSKAQHEQNANRGPQTKAFNSKVKLKRQESGLSNVDHCGNPKKNKERIRTRQNYASQGSDIVRSRSVSNGNLAMKKKQSGTAQSNCISSCTANLSPQAEQLEHKKADLKTLLAPRNTNPVNQEQNKRRKKASSANYEIPPSDNTQDTQKLMLKSAIEENNAKVAALKSLIKLSSNSSTSQRPQNNSDPKDLHNKCNPDFVGQHRNIDQLRQIAQNFKPAQGKGQFFLKCTSASQAQKQSQQQFMARIPSTVLANHLNENYQTQRKGTNLKEQHSRYALNGCQDHYKSGPVASTQQPIGNTSQVQVSSADKENSLKQKPKKDATNNMKAKTNCTQGTVQESCKSIAVPSSQKPQIRQHQRMHQVIQDQQNKNTYSQPTGSRHGISRNAFKAQKTQNESGAESAASTQLRIVRKGSHSSFTGEGPNQNCQGPNPAYYLSRKNSVQSNGSAANIHQLTQKIIRQSPQLHEQTTQNCTSDKPKQRAVTGKHKNATKITFNSNFAESALEVKRSQKEEPKQDLSLCSTQKGRHNQHNDNDKKLDFQNQLSPASFNQSLSQGSQMELSEHQEQKNIFHDDESIVVIEEDQLSMPPKKLGRSQSILDFQEVDQGKSNGAQRVVNSIFEQKHHNSVLIQQSLVKQQTSLQRESKMQKSRRANEEKTCSIQEKSKEDYNDKSGDFSLLKASQSFQIIPQFEDISFKIETCNQIKAHRNLRKPIQNSQTLNLPDDNEDHEKMESPSIGRKCWQADQNFMRHELPSAQEERDEDEVIQGDIEGSVLLVSRDSSSSHLTEKTLQNGSQ